MTTWAEIVAAVVVHSSTAALSHFGVTLEPAEAQAPQPVAERVVARTPRAVERSPDASAEPVRIRARPAVHA